MSEQREKVKLLNAQIKALDDLARLNNTSWRDRYEPVPVARNDMYVKDSVERLAAYLIIKDSLS